MEQIFTLLLLFVVVGLLNRFVKAAKGQQGRTQVPDDAEDKEPIGGASGDLRDLIMEELGLGLERRPKVMELPQPAEPSGAVVYPKEREPVAEAARARSEGAEVITRRGPDVPQRRSAREPRRPSRRPERRAAVSLERPRRPEDHELFHERYAVPAPVETHTQFHERYMDPETVRRRARSAVRLPEQPHWSAAQKAIVWAELLGPPKGLTF